MNETKSTDRMSEVEARLIKEILGEESLQVSELIVQKALVKVWRTRHQKAQNEIEQLLQENERLEKRVCLLEVALKKASNTLFNIHSAAGLPFESHYFANWWNGAVGKRVQELYKELDDLLRSRGRNE